MCPETVLSANTVLSALPSELILPSQSSCSSILYKEAKHKTK